MERLPAGAVIECEKGRCEKCGVCGSRYDNNLFCESFCQHTYFKTSDITLERAKFEVDSCFGI